MRKKSVLKKLLFAGLVVGTVFAGSCGGGGGSSSGTGGATISSNSQAQAVSQASVSTLNSTIGLGRGTSNSGGTSNLGGLSVDSSSGKSEGWLRSIINFYQDKKSNISTQQLRSQETYTGNCSVEGTYTVNIDQNGNGTITYNNCKETCAQGKYTIMNGTVVFYEEDTDGNNIPNKLKATFKAGFTYENQCDNEKVIAEKDFSESIVGKWSNGDIWDKNYNWNADLTVNGGPIILYEGTFYSKSSFNNLSYSYYEYDLPNSNGDYEYQWSAKGSYVYEDNRCVKTPITISLNTTNVFKGINDYCEYTGFLSINNNLITFEAYDPDNNPKTENNYKLTFNGKVIFNDVCTNLKPPETCQ